VNNNIMRLSTRSKYGLRAIFTLARSDRNSPVTLRALALENNISFKYLERVFIPLKASGIVSAYPGKKGGYFLAKPANTITLGEVIRILDGTIAPVSCVSRIAYKPCTCPDKKSCPLQRAMEEVREAMVSILDHKTIADYIGGGKEKEID